MHPSTPSHDSPDPSDTPQTPPGPAKTCTPCTATTSAGFPCRAWAVRGSDPPRCAPHRRSPSGGGGGRWRIGAPDDNTNALKHGVYAASSLLPDLQGPPTAVSGAASLLPPVQDALQRVGSRGAADLDLSPSSVEDALQGRGTGMGARLAARIVDLERRVDQLSLYLDQFTVGRRSPNGGDGTDGTITIRDYAGLVALHGQLCSRLARLLREERELYHVWREDEIQKATYEALDVLSEMWGVDL